MVEMRIERKEIKYAVIGVIFILAWFLFIRPAIAPTLEKIHPLFAMFIFQIGLFGGLLMLSSFLNGHQFHIRFSTITFVMLMGINLLTPPYLVTQDGLIHQDIDYWYVSSDAAFGTLWASFIPASVLWYFVYILTPILLMIVIPVLIADPTAIKRTLQV